MGETIFDFTLRTLECDCCGAPVSGTIAGGQVRCQYCGAQMLVSARVPRPRPTAPVLVDEASRLAGLRTQLDNFDSDRALIRLPEELEPFHRLLADPATRAAAEEACRRQWERARRSVVAAGAAAGQEEQTLLFRLALALGEHYAASDARRARAVLETAIELIGAGELSDVLRSRLARYALLMGDVEAGAAWLAEVDPRPLRLEVDTEVRLSLALLALRQQDYGRVFELLGRDGSAVPMRWQAGLLPWALRAHALAGVGEHGAAIRQLRHVGQTYAFGNDAETTALFSALPGPLSLAVARRAVAGGNRRLAAISSSSIMFVVAAIFVLVCVPPACPAVSCGGGYGAVIQALNGCPETRALLGDDITWALGCNNGESDCSSTSWQMPVKGSKARGTVRFTIRRQGGTAHLSGRVQCGAASAQICSDYQSWQR